MKKNFLIWFFLLALIYFFYRQALNSYFEGDEWFYFTIFLPLTRHPLGIIEAVIISFTKSNVVSGGGHVAPIYNLIWFLFTYFFGLNYKFYIFTSFLIHSINSFLVYAFVFKSINKKSIAFLSAIIFAITATHYQAITWVMAVVPTQIAVFFALCGVISFTYWMENGKNKYLKATIILFLSALFTKETAIPIILLVPVLAFWKGKETIKAAVKISVITFLIYLPIRFIVPFVTSGSVILDSHIPLQRLLFYQLLLFERISVEAFVPSNILFYLAKIVSENVYFKMSIPVIPDVSHELYLETIGSDLVIFLLSPIFAAASFLIIRGLYLKKKNYQVLLFAILIILTSAMPLLFILSYAPWWIDGSSIDSRHLYFPSIGVSILLSYGLCNIHKVIPGKNSKKLVIFVLSMAFIIWGLSQLNLLQQKIDNLITLSRTRKDFLEKIYSLEPVTKERSVILIESDSHYFGFPNIPPFQTNLGQILAIYYFNKNIIPEEFISDQSFVMKGIMSEGVINNKKKIFGYYTRSSSLLKDLALKKFTVDDIKSYTWEGKSNTLAENTQSTQTVAKEFLNNYINTRGWRAINTDYVKFKYPNDFILELNHPETDTVVYEYTLWEKQDTRFIKIKIIKKDKTLPFHIFLQQILPSSDLPDGSEISLKNIVREDGTPATIVYLKGGNSSRYFMPFGNGSGYMELVGQSIQDSTEIERILSTSFF